MTNDRTYVQAPKKVSDVVTFRVFVAPRAGFVWTRKQRIDRCNETRREAADFINNEVGTDNLVSVSESNSDETFEFAVSVWYRDHRTAKEKLGDFE